MRLKINPIFSQRDSQWSSILLGNNKNQPYNIGNYGCLISCYAMFLSSIGKPETPKTVNEKLKPEGFTKDSGELIWSAPCNEWGITNDYISPTYDGPVTNFGVNKMKALLDEGKPLICHVDFDPQDIDDDMHWVLVYGYEPNTEIFYICDPWTGRSDLTLDVYGGTRRAVIQFRTYTQTVPKQDQPTSSQDQALQECQINLQKEIQTKNETYQELQEWKFKYEEEIEAHKKTQENTDNVLNQQISIVDPTGALQIKTFANVNAQIKTLLLKEDTLRQLEAKHTECVTTLTVVQQKQAELEEANKGLTLTNTQQSEHAKQDEETINSLKKENDELQNILKDTTTHESLFKIGKLSICKVGDKNG
jgi:hypothetical protein